MSKVITDLYRGTIFGIPFTIEWGALIIFLYALPWSNSVLDYILIVVSWLLLVIIHELGHAAFARAQEQFVYEIRMTFWGGECLITSPERKYEMAVIAWGGIVFQAAVLAGAFFLFLKFPRHPQGIVALLERPLLSVFIAWNFLTILVNLLPLRNLDGRYAWYVIPYHFKRFFYGKRKKNNTGFKKIKHRKVDRMNEYSLWKKEHIDKLFKDG